MRATPSKDGRYRFDLRVTFRVGESELALLLAASRAGEDIGGLPERLSRKAVVEEVKRYLARRGGDEFDGWSDDLDPDEARAVEEWARSVVQRAFPELK
ncbi:hypothetical protein [Streptomyces sp. NPDC057552]|uniref:hypothetical protein n=1 Tax=Streptomyces sp. NPDC057552 TaxID=3350537 RepID=UPI003690450C